MRQRSQRKRHERRRHNAARLNHSIRFVSGLKSCGLTACFGFYAVASGFGVTLKPRRVSPWNLTGDFIL